MADPLNSFNSPWRVSPAEPHHVIGADSSVIATVEDLKHASIVSAAASMYFALEAFLAYYEPDTSEEAEIRNLGVMALEKAKGNLPHE